VGSGGDVLGWGAVFGELVVLGSRLAGRIEAQRRENGSGRGGGGAWFLEGDHEFREGHVCVGKLLTGAFGTNRLPNHDRRRRMGGSQ
jgi:hypothetical protein